MEHSFPSKFSLLLLLMNIFGRSVGADLTVEQKIREDSDLSQFYSLLENNLVANSTLQLRSCTVFAPQNSAFQKYTGAQHRDLVLYHMTNSAQNLNVLGTSVSSELEGNPPLWITRTRDNNREEIYVNNAKIVTHRSNYQNTNINKKQVLHIVDDVLEPVWSISQDLDVNNPDAFQFLNRSENLNLDKHRVRSFRQRVQVTGKSDLFRAEGRYTFFIPVDEGFQPPPRPEKIDAKVIDGHIIPGKVLFTKPTPSNKEYETMAFTDMLKVTISFSTETDNKGAKKTYIKSHTIIGDQTHSTGVVLAEIVKGNIPVKNGVVHLIHRPLMVVDTTVTQFLESFKGFDREDGPLYKFYETIRDTGGDFMDRITRLRELTLFAPSNAAWEDSNLNNLLRDRSKIQEILNMHLVEQKLTLDKIITNNQNQIATSAPRRSLYFNVLQTGANKTLTVEGGGVNATVIQPDIAAINGIVHIIDRVLGVPFTTVGRKLATDPMINKTNHLGIQENFNYQLDDMRRRFTYFVPRDYAWSRLETRYPSAHKKIFMKEFGYHVKQILERHLVVADVSYTMAELKRMSNETITLPTVRDVLKLRVKENDNNVAENENHSVHTGYYIEWNNEWVHVFRPDVECTNGVIHVIDQVLVRESDIVVTGASATLGLPTLITLALSILTARWLL
ncbi:fasciclin-1 isoform X3 [Nilaparvata lugens]|uniref:fasciclin-1 isoform X3 n=1 Tax=Nilaparvata lugens TaxID=108931 RepID=UPI00193CF179|nr:fasciclin-1 isoform X3 [Nilaparvata lugens]